ncbi:MAG: ZIP family metal transporter [Syntrophomonadaceae bacterium]
MLVESLRWSIAAGLGTLLGAVMIFIRRRWSARGLAFFLGLAAGVMTAVVVFDMLPSAFLFGPAGIALGGIAVGLMFMVAGDYLLGSRKSGSHSLLGLGYLIMLGIAMHDLPEGMAIALGDLMKNRTGMVIALGIGIHNIPEGMAIAVPLVMAGMKKPLIFTQVLLLSLITPLGTLLGIYLISLLPALMPLLLGLASGIMAYLVAFQLWPQARTQDLFSSRRGFWLGMVIILAATFI